jgi:predicted Zn-dependent peptidase
VYEEFNRAQDNDGRTAYKKLNELLYPNHPYGTQTTIGTGEHLKNPSMVKIHEFFDTYYVPNNMAVILAGDIDYDRTIALVDKYFGKWEKGYVPDVHVHAGKHPLLRPSSRRSPVPKPSGWIWPGASVVSTPRIRSCCNSSMVSSPTAVQA